MNPRNSPAVAELFRFRFRTSRATLAMGATPPDSVPPAGRRTVMMKVHHEATAVYFEPVIEAVSEAGGELHHILEEEKNQR